MRDFAHLHGYILQADFKLCNRSIHDTLEALTDRLVKVTVCCFPNRAFSLTWPASMLFYWK